MTEPNWVDLDGVVNMRDLGGRTTADGRRLRDGVVLRSDNLHDLPDASVRVLLDDYRLSDIVDLRTNGEHARSGEFPLDGAVRLHKMSLYPEDDPDDPMPPWVGELGDDLVGEPEDLAHGVARHYLNYFRLRPDSLVGALRVVANAEGTTVINCAAGKDRTGTTSALLLAAVGVPDDQIIADYAASNERVPAILARLGVAASAGSPEHDAQVASQSTPPEVMVLVLQGLDEHYGGVRNWLSDHGWTADDQARLEARLLD